MKITWWITVLISFMAILGVGSYLSWVYDKNCIWVTGTIMNVTVLKNPPPHPRSFDYEFTLIYNYTITHTTSNTTYVQDYVWDATKDDPNLEKNIVDWKVGNQIRALVWIDNPTKSYYHEDHCSTGFVFLIVGSLLGIIGGFGTFMFLLTGCVTLFVKKKKEILYV